MADAFETLSRHFMLGRDRSRVEYVSLLHREAEEHERSKNLISLASESEQKLAEMAPDSEVFTRDAARSHVESSRVKAAQSIVDFVRAKDDALKALRLLVKHGLDSKMAETIIASRAEKRKKRIELNEEGEADDLSGCSPER